MILTIMGRAIKKETLADRMRSLVTLTSHVEASAADVDAELKKRFARLGGEAPLPDWKLEMELMVRDLRERWDELNEIEKKIDAESLEEAADRRQRDATSLEVHGQLLDLKRSLEASLTKSEVGQVFPIRGEIPRRANLLEIPAAQTVTNLRRWKPSSNSGPSSFEAERRIEPLDRDVRRMIELSDRVRLRQRKIEGLRIDRRRKLDAYDEDFVEYSTVIASYFKLAGFTDKVRTLRPSKKYAGRTQAQIRHLGKR